MTDRRGLPWIGLICLLTSVGCAAVVPYRYGHFQTDAPAAWQAEPTGPAVEFGKPIKTLDRIASVVGLPEQIMGLDSKISNHAVSLDTVGKVRSYLNQNDLADVAIYVNCYDPREQWRRLRENRQVGAGWRYSLGTLSIIEYSLLPGRVFGGDTYNPYTNTLNIDSDVPAIAILEAALAKGVHAHKMPGTFATLTGLPGVALVRRCRAMGDVLGYARAQHDWETERQVYHVLYSQVGAETASIAGVVLPVWWAMPALGMGGAAAGHVTGRMLAAHRAAQIDAAAQAKSLAGPEAMPGNPDAPPNEIDAAAPGSLVAASLESAP